MKTVIDSNRVIAALIKESTTREILFDRNFEFVAPDHIISEVKTHRNAIIDKAGITESGLDILLALIFQQITIIPQNEYDEFVRKLGGETKDPNDLPYLAACIAAKAKGIWTHDAHFKEQKNIIVFTNIDMLRISGKNKED